METAPATTDAELVRVDRVSLTTLVLKLLQRKGMFAVEAEILLARLLEADANGLSAEGVGSLPLYLDAMDLGDFDPRARIVTLKDGPATALLDGSTGMGHVTATRAMLLAIEKARAVGTGTVVVKNSRLCGDVGGIAKLAADAGLIGFVTNSFTEQAANDVGDHAVAWALPATDGSTPVIIRDHSGSWGESPSFAIGMMSAGLAGTEPMSRKRKANRVSNTVEHFIQAIDPELFGSRETLLSKWGATLTARQHSTTLDVSTTIPLLQDDVTAMKELAAKVKLELVVETGQ
jgi:LDH2 family malate/lactate/ureidoglycolate dehydrogenase